jgi:hypothetical protein
VHALRRGYRVSLLGAGRRHLELLGLQGDRAEATLLEALARARADGDTPYEAVVQRLLARHGRGGTVVLFEVEPEGRDAAADSSPAAGLAAALGTLRARVYRD